MKNICFFNHWHNGDVFAAKGYMQDIQRQFGFIQYTHLHTNHAKVMQDLPMIHGHCDLLDEQIHDHLKFGYDDEEMFINTWVGAWGWDGGVIPRGEEHVNYDSLHRMFRHLYNYLNDYNGMKLIISDNPLDYVAETFWTSYDVEPADLYFEKTKADRFHLICNGKVRSTQSNLGDMKSVVEQLAAKYPQDVFVCTAKFDTDMTNINFTDDIFGLENDINEIAYLSTGCSTIVGKNSGPYMFCHVRENIFDKRKSFVSLSHRVSDCYPCYSHGLGCHYYHCSSDEEALVFQAIDHAITNADTKASGKVTVLD